MPRILAPGCRPLRYRKASGRAWWRDFYALRVLAWQSAMSARVL
jgi:hypothetical protein